MTSARLFFFENDNNLQRRVVAVAARIAIVTRGVARLPAAMPVDTWKN